jgi:hypothetical protein
MIPVCGEPSPWESVDLPQGCLAWITEVDRVMWRDWYLTSSLAGWDRDQLLRYWPYQESPEEFVDWYAEKYDLIRFT